MDPSDYRRDYAAYSAATERARFEHHAGLSPRLELRPAEERYADLWTRETVEDLRRRFDETHAQFETERAGLRALAGTAALKYAGWRAREVSEELRSCAESGRFEWSGARVSASEVPGLLSVERDATRRRELTRRRLDAVGACDDLRAARLEALNEAARELGFEGRRALYEEFAGLSLEALAAGAESFLRRTESAYMSALAEWSSRELAPGAWRAPEYADLLFFERAADTEAQFPARDFRGLYAETLAGLGVRVESQQGLRVDDAMRPGTSSDSACFAVTPPEDVRLVVGASAGGLGFFGRSLVEGGRAQMFAWASRETSRRHPEFVYAPDRATELGHGLLLAGLLREPGWLEVRRRMRAAEAAAVARRGALLDLYQARRECASVACALAIERAAGVRTEQLAEEYAATFTEATGFRHEAATHLLDVDEWFESATALRARLFAAALREHLRESHGRRWFESRGAGEELIDVWNTASRYRVEELSKLLWGGEPGFEPLADASAAALTGRDG
ncbi:MAG: hypothetical protein QOH49_4896 [Acidobacteriota bacterium]|jgi:hypothetical protein|nr:hypothetical protein [Acidobacteriota bacterium]